MMNGKRFYWIRLKMDFFSMAAIDYLMSQKNGCEYIVLYLILCLLTANNEGLLSSQVGEMIIPFDVNKIARDTKFSVDTVVVALELFKKLGLIYEQEDGVLKIPYVNQIVGSESEHAEKKRRERNRKKETLSPTLSPTPSPTFSDTKSDKRLETRDKSIDADIVDADANTIYNVADKIIVLYNKTCSSLNQVCKINSERQKNITAITKIYTDEEIKTVFVKANSSDFLSGKVSNFRASFDWLIKPSNFVKVLEGNYDNHIGERDKPSYDAEEIQQRHLKKYNNLSSSKASYDLIEMEKQSYEMYKDL